jgi:hypothetical protein
MPARRACHPGAAGGKHPAIAGVARPAMNNSQLDCLLHETNLQGWKKAAAHSLASTLHFLPLE